MSVFCNYCHTGAEYEKTFCQALSPDTDLNCKTDFSLNWLLGKQSLDSERIGCAASKLYENVITLKGICGRVVLLALKVAFPF